MEEYRWELATGALIHDIGKLYQKSEANKINKIDILHDSNKHPLMAETFILNHLSVFKQVFNNEELELIKECSVRHHSGVNFGDEVNPSKAIEKWRRYCYIVSNADSISSSERSEKHKIKDAWKKENASLETPFNRLSTNTNRQVDNDLLTSMLEGRKVYKLTTYDSSSFETIKSTRVHDAKEMTDFIKEFDNEVDKIEACTKETFFNKLKQLIRNYTWCIPSDSTEALRDVSLYQHLVTTSAIAVALNEDCVTKGYENLRIVKIVLDGAEGYITKQSKTGLDAVDVIVAKNYSMKDLIDKTTYKIVEQLGLTSANILIDNKSFEKFILISKGLESNFENVVKELNKELMTEYMGELCISYNITKLEFNKDIDKQSGYKKMQSMFSNNKSKNIDGHTLALSNNLKTWNLDSFVINSEAIGKCEYCGRLTTKTGTVCNNCKNELNLIKQNPDVSDFDLFKANIKKKSNKLGVVVIDADKVIETMQNGFIDYEGNDHGTISRVATYSSILSDFFDKYLRLKLNSEYIININANKAIILCDNCDVVDIALRVMNLFDDYTAKKLTLSISIKTVGINERLSSISYDGALNKLKEQGGNLISLDGLVLDSNDLKSYLYVKEKLLKSINDGAKKSCLQRYSDYSRMYKDYLVTGDVEKLIIHPLYIRNQKYFKGIDEELQKLVTNAFSNLFKEPNKIDKLLYMLETIAYDCSLELRSQEGNM